MKNKEVITNYCFCSSAMLTSKIITGIIENYSEFSGGAQIINVFQVALVKP